MKKLSMLFILGYMLAQNTVGQSVAINTTGNVADPSAILDVFATNKGILPPRMTIAQRNLIPSPANSLLIFQTDNDSGYYYYNQPSATWLKFSTYQSGQNQSPSCLSTIPRPIFSEESVASNLQYDNTKANLGKVLIPLGITINKLSVASFGSVTIPGKAKIALYSETGLNKLFELTTDTIFQSQNTITTTLNNSCIVSPGFYYIAVLPIGNASLDLLTYRRIPNSHPLLNIVGLTPIQGILIVPANTLPATINPQAIVYDESRCLYFRLDN